MAKIPFYKPDLVIVISGPSGSGKSTVIDALCKADETLRESVSVTTRNPRPNEVDGVDYHFRSKSEFEKHVAQGNFLEWAEYGGNFYGTLKSEITAVHEAGKDVILEIEVQGALQIREQDLSPSRSLLIFIIPPSLAILEKRLRRRKTESESEVNNRLAIAKSEVLEIEHYDYWVRNPENAVQEAVQQIRTIIAAERSRIDTQLIETINPLIDVDKSN